MIINTIDIKQYSTSALICTEDGMFHKKGLPFLSIVQALEGSYGIAVDALAQQNTHTMGVFVAPKGKMQYITHYLNADTAVMRAHWIFLDVIINGTYTIDDLFDFPVLMPPQYNQTVYEIIANVRNNTELCDNLSDIYRLIKILLAISTPKKEIDYQTNEICHYIRQHYSDKITPGQLAKQFSISVPTLFRKFQKSQGITPSNYINSVRLAQAVILLETTDRLVAEICLTVGIEDIFYFSKLFKRKYGVSPENYRKQYRN